MFPHSPSQHTHTQNLWSCIPVTLWAYSLTLCSNRALTVSISGGHPCVASSKKLVPDGRGKDDFKTITVVVKTVVRRDRE